jgi:hypothetical protein
MALRLFSITKRADFQGRTEEWSNVYCYDTAASSGAQFQAIIDDLVTAEKAVHSTQVTYVRAMVYTTQGLNGILDLGAKYYETTLSGAGTATAGVLYRECAFLVKWPMDPTTDIFGRSYHRALKKWLHSCTDLGGGAAIQQGNGAIAAPATTILNTYANAVITAVDGSALVAPGTGDGPTGGHVIHPYLEHRQFPRGRKE